MSDFWVLKCKNPKCRHFQVREVRDDIHKVVFRCLRCKGSYKLKKKNEYGLNLEHKGKFYDSLHAAMVCKEANAERGVFDNNFYSRKVKEW